MPNRAPARRVNTGIILSRSEMKITVTMVSIHCPWGIVLFLFAGGPVVLHDAPPFSLQMRGLYPLRKIHLHILFLLLRYLEEGPPGIVEHSCQDHMRKAFNLDVVNIDTVVEEFTPVGNA